MDIAAYAIKNKVVTYVLMVLIIVGGFFSYQKLGRLEDPEFTIKTAVIYTQYPGATPTEVEEEVTEKIESAVQQLKQIDKVRSISKSGLSIVYADIKDQYDKDTIPQVWDELRRKVKGAERNLPQGVKAPIVNDDFADVFGVFYAITGNGYTYKELSDFAVELRKEVLLAQDVAKVDISGDQTEVVFVEIARSKLAQLGIDPNIIFQTLHQQNIVSESGKLAVGNEYINLRTTGAFASVAEIGDLMIPAGSLDKLVYLKDIADSIHKGYYTPAQSYIKFNGAKALGFGVSTVPGGNVVVMGDAVKAKISEFSDNIPTGIELNKISFQSETVKQSVDGFVLNLFEALGIVILLLVVFMGLREGVLIGLVLLLTILATFIGMDLMGVSLQRISLGALIIALGMLVDNAIVVAEGIVIKIEGGMDKTEASSKTVKETMWPLLGATIIAILAFAAISLSNDTTGEFLGSLFKVIAVSLMLSWVMAITVTPLLCVVFLQDSEHIKQSHDNKFYDGYRSLLKVCIKYRILFISVLVAILIGSFYGFTKVEKSFFPDSSRPQYLVDVWLQHGTHIDSTAKRVAEIDSYIRKLEGVESTTQFIGKGATRFILTYSPEEADGSYGQVLVTVDDYHKIDAQMQKVEQYLNAQHPDIQKKLRRFALGPGEGAKIEARFSGPDIKVLRQLAEQAKDIMRGHSNAKVIKDNWREKVKVVKAELAEAKARNTGITRADLNAALAMTMNGTISGVYREGDDIQPIIVRPPENERRGYDDIKNIQLYSRITNRYVPIEQVVDNLSIEWEDEVIKRRNRKRTITAQCDPKVGNASVLFAEIKPQIEAMEIPQGYEMEWGGEYENSQEAEGKLMAKVPIAFTLMFLISVFLFNAIRQPIIIFLGLPLSIIGVAAGLLLSGVPYGFMALLGMLSLAGMLIKNEIVLLDQINIEIDEGKSPYQAVLDASVSRVRPVSMAAFTTVLGMAPLLFDPFFIGMAVTIMAGLTFATILTLVVIPVLYATFFHVKREEDEKKTPAKVEG